MFEMGPTVSLPALELSAEGLGEMAVDIKEKRPVVVVTFAGPTGTNTNALF